MKKILILLAILAFSFGAVAQTAEAYDTEEKTSVGLLDPSRFTVNHAISFGMSSTSGSSLQSQSLYTTALTYTFAQPVTVNLTFGLPIHSTYNSAQNLNAENIQSADYLKNMPFEATMAWDPSDKFHMRLTIARNTYPDYYGYGMYSSRHRAFGGIGLLEDW